LEKPSVVVFGDGSGSGGTVSSEDSWDAEGRWARLGTGVAPPSAGGAGFEVAESARRLVFLPGDDDDKKPKDDLRPDEEGLRSWTRVFGGRGLPPATSSLELVGRAGLLVGDGGGSWILVLAVVLLVPPLPPPPKRDEKKGAADWVGVAAERCMSCVVGVRRPRRPCSGSRMQRCHLLPPF
jgi:dipeptidyl aminopeptidase/acylaminoacyl peptidase